MVTFAKSPNDRHLTKGSGPEQSLPRPIESGSETPSKADKRRSGMKKLKSNKLDNQKRTI